jgi:hypothetical protein
MPPPSLLCRFSCCNFEGLQKEKKVEDIWKWSGKNLINFFEKEKSVSDWAEEAICRREGVRDNGSR